MRRRLPDIAAAAVAPLALAVAAALVHPTGEFPISDDFDFAATAFDLARYGEVRLSDWPAMTLVAHAAWGATFVRIFGESHFVLRIATLALAAAAVVAAYAWVRQCGATRTASVFAALFVALNPMFLAYACTFMTDVAGCAGLIVLLAVLTATWRTERTAAWCGIGALASVAYLVRQVAVLPVFVALTAMMFVGRWRTAFALGLPLAVTAGAHWWWLNAVHGVPFNALRPTIRPELLFDAPELGRRLLRLVMTTGLWIAPATISWLSWLRRREWLLAASGAAAVVILALMMPDAVRPYNDEVVHDLGVGVGLPFRRGDALRGPELALLGQRPSLFQLATVGLAAVSLGILVALAPRLRIAFRASSPGWRLGAATLAGLIAFALLSAAFYERYLMPVFLLTGIMLLMTLPGRPSSAARTALAAFAAFGVVGLQDDFCRRRVVWEALEALRKSGIPADKIDGGPEFFLQHVFNPAYRGRPRRVRPWLGQVKNWTGHDPARSRLIAAMAADPLGAPSSSRPYKAALKSEPGWTIVSSTRYQSWLRSGEVLILRRSQPSSPPDTSRNGRPLFDHFRFPLLA